MKKPAKLILSVFAVATTLVSCTKDNNPTTVTDPMLGIWTMDSAVLSVPSKDPQTLNIIGDCTTKSYFNLKATNVMEEGDLEPSTCKMTVVNGSWKKTDNILEITDDKNATETFYIISATANKLIVRDTNFSDSAPAGSYIEATLTKKQ